MIRGIIIALIVIQFVVFGIIGWGLITWDVNLLILGLTIDFLNRWIAQMFSKEITETSKEDET